MFAEKYLEDAMNEKFTDAVWTDECSVQLETHRRFCCRKIGQPPKPRYVCWLCNRENMTARGVSDIHENDIHNPEVISRGTTNTI